jgi:hypothetical protein
MVAILGVGESAACIALSNLSSMLVNDRLVRKLRLSQKT